ncbi:MAG: GerMN domain-containing protein [Acidimicrobiia bacterium]|nr:GerMN domain-containing protein [Acidimicrobiia bacterium]
MTTRRRALLAIVLVVLSLIAACGIPKDSHPRLIAEEPEGFNTSTQPTIGVGGLEVHVYLIDGQADPLKLAARKRPTTQQPGPLEAVAALLLGLTKDDDVQGYQTKIPQGTQLRDDSKVDGKLVTIDLSSEISTISAQNAVQAYAQLVYTATQYPSGPSQVQFLTEGKPINAQTDAATKSVVGRSDYRSLAPKS